MNDPRLPSWLSLVTLWLQTHFEGRPAVVFSLPLQSIGVLQEHFAARTPAIDTGELISSEYAILPCASSAEATRICNGVPDHEPNKGWAMAWDGSKIVSNSS